MTDDDRGGSAERRRKCYMLATRLRLAREERLELSAVLLWRDVASWKDLTDAEIIRVLDAFEGFTLINSLLTKR